MIRLRIRFLVAIAACAVAYSHLAFQIAAYLAEHFTR